MTQSDEVSQFREVAPWYDILMADVPYDMWLRYVLSLYELHRPHLQAARHSSAKGPLRVLDLACGTGAMALRFAKMGCSVVGVDLSEDMIRVARQRAREMALDMEFIAEDAATMRLPARRFDLCVSLFDSLNYIIEPERLQAAMCRVADALDDDGVFVFDMNTPYALRERLFDQEDQRASSAIRYRWRSSFDEATRLCTIRMEFNTAPKGSADNPFVEIHRQRAYDATEIEAMLRAAGFAEVASYHAYTYDPCSEAADRAYYVAVKERQSA